MKNLIILIIGLAFWLIGCVSVTKNSFETTIKVVDMNNKPMPNQIVRFKKSTINWDSKFEKSVLDFLVIDEVSNASGIAKFSYDLFFDDITQVANFIVKDDTIFKTVNMASHTSLGRNNKNFEPEFTIRMDTLKPFKIRMKSDRADIKRLYISVGARLSSNESSIVDRNFERFLTETSKDTVFSVKTFSKSDFWIYSSAQFGGLNSTWFAKEIKIDNKINRDSVFIINH